MLYVCPTAAAEQNFRLLAAPVILYVCSKAAVEKDRTLLAASEILYVVIHNWMTEIPPHLGIEI